MLDLKLLQLYAIPYYLLMAVRFGGIIYVSAALGSWDLTQDVEWIVIITAIVIPIRGRTHTGGRLCRVGSVF